MWWGLLDSNQRVNYESGLQPDGFTRSPKPPKFLLYQLLPKIVDTAHHARNIDLCLVVCLLREGRSQLQLKDLNLSANLVLLSLVLGHLTL